MNDNKLNFSWTEDPSVGSRILKLQATRQSKTTLVSSYGASKNLNGILTELTNGEITRFHVIADRGTLRHHPSLHTNLNELTISGQATLLTIPGGERAKSLAKLKEIVSWIDSQAVKRRSEPIVAIGGGAVLDVVSLGANLYRRGVSLVKVPSTLLGVVDAGLGVKTAINFHGRKNLVGTYSPPMAIIVDTSLLSTLSQRALRNGISEMMKVAVARDRGLWNALERDVTTILRTKCQSPDVQETIMHSIESMINAIWPDLWEQELNRPTDFGHSVSKAIEEELSPRPSHGEAVAFDMAITMATSVNMKLLPHTEFTRVINFMKVAGLMIDHPAINRKILEHGIRDGSVHRDGSTKWPLPDRIGNTAFYAVKIQDVLTGQQFLRSYLNNHE